MKTSRLLRAGTPLALAVTLAACVVVPVDPRTGAPVYAAHPVDGAARGAPPPIVWPSGPAGPVVLTARLYPLNPQAAKAGPLTAVVVDALSGRGSFSVGYAGETLQGEATRVDGAYAAFGRLHTEVLGSAPRAWGSGQRGIANAAGARGVHAQCEYLITAPGQGTGVCLFSDGARYQVHFGA